MARECGLTVVILLLESTAGITHCALKVSECLKYDEVAGTSNRNGSNSDMNMWNRTDCWCNYCLYPNDVLDSLEVAERANISIIRLTEIYACEWITRSVYTCLWFTNPRRNKAWTIEQPVVITCPPSNTDDEITAIESLSLLISSYGKETRTVHINCHTSLKNHMATHSLNGRELKISTVEHYPYIIKNVAGSTLPFSGIYIDVLNVLAHDLNFRISEPKDQSFGRLKDGFWNGLVGQLVRHETDMVVGPLSIDYQRIKVISYTVPVKVEYTAIILKLPDQVSDPWQTLIKPFSMTVMICLAATLVLSSALLFLMEEKDLKNSAVLDIATKMLYILIFYIGLFFRANEPYRPQRESSRVALSSWLLFSLLMATIYTGSLMSFLTVKKEAPPFSTLREMVERDHSYKMGVIGQSSNQAMFEFSKNPIYRTLHHKIKTFSMTDPDVLSTNMSVHRSKVKNGNYAFLGSNMVLQIWKRELCSLIILEEKSIVQYYAFGLPLKSMLTDVISLGLLRLREGGIIAKIEERWRQNQIPCERRKQANAQPLDLSTLNPVFVVAGLGCFCSLMVLLCEVFVQKSGCSTNKKLSQALI